MKYIPMRKIAHNLDEMGYTTGIEIEFNVYDDRGNRLNASLEITQEDIKEVNDRLDIETIGKPQLDTVARRKLRAWLQVEREEPEENEEGEPEE